MELLNIQRAFEKELLTISSDLDTSYPNDKYEPKQNTPYQKVQLVPSDVENPTLGDTYYREVGEFQIFLCYPIREGTMKALTKAHLIRDTFNRGKTLIESGTEVIINRTPKIMQGIVANDRYVVPVIIQYFAGIMK